MLHVLVGFNCVYVLHITRSKLKIVLARSRENRYFGNLSVVPRLLRGIFLFLIMLRHPANSAARVGVVWLCLCVSYREKKGDFERTVGWILRKILIETRCFSAIKIF